MMFSKILITGSHGQLGRDLMDSFSGNYEVCGIDIDSLDLRDANKVLDFMSETKPDIVIHAAAYTDVDGCEGNVDLAMNSNVIATANLVAGCKETDAKLIFFSTDYVFDGTKELPYLEDDTPNPQTVYGKSKLLAESIIEEHLNDFAILRIAWLYGANGKNFPKTIIKAGLDQINARRQGRPARPLTVVDDQIGNPTWTIDVVKQTWEVFQNDLRGLFHCSAEGETSWYQFSKDIFELLQLDVEIKPCKSFECPRPAPRPRYSSLENRHLKNLGINVMQHYKRALGDFINQHKGNLLCQIQP